MTNWQFGSILDSWTQDRYGATVMDLVNDDVKFYEDHPSGFQVFIVLTLVAKKLADDFV